MSTSSSARAPLPVLQDYAYQRDDTIRLSDLDFQRHVNNAAVTALFANARFDYLSAQVRPHLAAPDDKLVIARLEVDFTGELEYGAPVTTGTKILGLGSTSMRLEQAIFQNGRCAARALCVFVYKAGGQGTTPWPEAVRSRLDPPAQNN